MKYSFFSRIRDILFLCALVLLAKTAIERTTSFIKLHKDSMIHELDTNFIDQIYTAQRQLHFLEEHPLYAHEYANALAEIKQQLATIEEKYKKNSPGLALLGPIGSAAIVVKEAQLEQKLLNVVNDLSAVFAKTNNSSEFMPAQTINCALGNNKQAIKLMA